MTVDEERYYEDDEIDLTELIGVLWRKRVFIIVGISAFTLLSIIIALLLPKTYESKGFFLLSKDENTALFLPQYKSYSSIFTNPQRLANFVKKKSLNSSFLENFKTSEDFKEVISPVYAYTKEDIRKMGQVNKGLRNYIVGVRISGESSDVDRAVDISDILGSFIKDSIIYGKIYDFVTLGYNENRSNVLKTENKIFENKFNLSILEKKKSFISSLLKKYPQMKKIANREVVSVQGSGYRYLPPLTQVVGIESAISDVKQNLYKEERLFKIYNLAFYFFKKMKEVLSKDLLGEELLKSLDETFKLFFKNKDLKNDINKEVWNNLYTSLENFRKIYYEDMRFISCPTLPEKPTKPNKKLIVIISFITSLFIFIFLAFMIEWWENNKDKLLKKNKSKKDIK